MKNILIVYATVEGHTRKIAQFLAEEARLLGFDAALCDAAGDPLLDPSSFGKVVLLAPVHLDKHHPALDRFLTEYSRHLRPDHSAFMSVSLSAAGDAEDRYTAWEYTRDFLSQFQWHPNQVEIVAGALKFTASDFFKRWAMKHLAHKKRIPASGGIDYEYTDWDALRRFIKQFLADRPETQSAKL